MPSLRLRLPQRWYERVCEEATRSNQTPEQLALGFLALSIPPPPEGKHQGRPIEEFGALTKRVAAFCRTLDQTRNEIVAALNALAPKAGANPRVHARRKITAMSLKAATRRKGLTQKAVSDHVGVSRAVVSAVMNGKKSLPPTWLGPLDELFGEGWLHERIEE